MQKKLIIDLEDFEDILEGNLAKSLSGIINRYGDVALKLLYNWSRTDVDKN